MHRQFLINQINNYIKSEHITKSEFADVKRFIEFVQQNLNCFERSNKGHITGSAWIVSNDYKRVLLTHHRKFNKWLQLGGHCDGQTNPADVALREAIEESGLNNFEFVLPEIYDIDIHPIPSACEFHYDVRFLLRAPKEDKYIVSEESLDLAWVDIDQVKQYSTEVSVNRMNEKCKLIFYKKFI